MTTSPAPATGMTVTIREAAEMCGVTVKAMRLRVEREQVPSLLKDGLRRIPVSALVKQGLVKEAPASDAASPVPPSVPPAIPHVDLATLLDRIEAQAVALHEHRQIAERSEAHVEEVRAELDRARRDLAASHEQVEQLRAELLLAEQRAARRRWFGISSRKAAR